MAGKTADIKKTRGYTLVELLVVLSIILIAFSIIGVSSNSGDGTKLSSAQRTLSGLVKAAHAQAILKNAPVRLIIHNDLSSIEQYRRFVGIVYYGTDKNGNDGWIATDKGTYLPKGIYFDAAASNTMSDTAWTLASATQINHPRVLAQNEGNGTHFLYYEFNRNGTSGNPNAYLIFRAGQVAPGAGGIIALNLPANNEQKASIRSGLLFRQSGTATLINDPEDINI